MIEEIMEFLRSSDTWAYRSRHDPEVIAAEKEFTAFVEKIRPRLSDCEYADLLDADSATSATYAEAGLLFGLYIADKLRELINDPYDRYN